MGIWKEVKSLFWPNVEVKSFHNRTSSLGGVAIYGTNNTSRNIEQYLTLDDVYSITKFRARTTAMIPLRVYKVKNEKNLRNYEFATKQKNFTTQGLIKKQLLKSIALEEVEDNNELQYLLDNPNETYSKFEFLEGVYTCPLLTGNSYVHMEAAELGVNAGKPKSLHLMPPQNTVPVVQGSFPKYISRYEMRLDPNAPRSFETEEVLHLRYFNPDFSQNGAELTGLSPLAALHRTSVRGASENDYMVRGFQNSGANGIVTIGGEGSADHTPEALGSLKSSFYNESSGTRNAQKTLFINDQVAYTQIGLGPVEMKVIESQKITFKKFCNAYFVSDVLFNNGETATESNVKEMVKRMYTNACLPDAYALRDLLNQKLTPLFDKDGTKYYIDVDITGISELQEDMQAMATIYSTLPIMNPAWISEAFGYGKDMGVEDRLYIKTGYTPIEDLDVPDVNLEDELPDEPIKE